MSAVVEVRVPMLYARIIKVPNSTILLGVVRVMAMIGSYSARGARARAA